MEDYWRLMPGYQAVRLEDIQPRRILFGYFPTYRASPLQPAWDRVLQARAGRFMCMSGLNSAGAKVQLPTCMRPRARGANGPLHVHARV